MTYGLDLFSDVRPASMPTIATITTTLSGLLVCVLSIIQDRSIVLRIVAFALIMGLGATSVNAAVETVPPIVVSRAASSDSQSCKDAYQQRAQELLGLQGNDLQHLLQVFQQASQANIICAPNASATWNWIFSSISSGGGKVLVNYNNGSFSLRLTFNVAEVEGCEVGRSENMNLGVGYAKTTANTDDWIDPQFYTTACASGCQATVGNVVVGSCYVSGIVGPPFPGYCDFETVTTGHLCTPADEAASSTLPAIPCPTGMQEGTVNGARGCYKVTDVTKETTTTQNPDGSTTTTETTTGPNGTTTTTTTCGGDGACSTTIQHIGGGAGTGAPGETGQDYDGKPDGGSEGEEGGEGVCGKEGLPDCKVKVNEDGTPETVEGAQEALTGVIDGVQERLEYLGGMGWVREDLPFVWGPSFPSGSCSAIEIYGQPINICDPLTKVRLVWAFIISFMAGLYIWRSGTQAIKG